jgi:hypothetical protein
LARYGLKGNNRPVMGKQIKEDLQNGKS